MKKVMYLGVALCAALLATSCKPKESAYKKAYEKAKQQELAQQAAAKEEVPVVSDVPVVVKEKAATTVTTPVVRKERVTPQNNASMKEYSVVCGSFLTKSNADALMERMQSAGYAAFLAQNPETKMYRVIISTFDTKQEAAVSRDDFKAKYPNDDDFQKAWILQRAY
ncbi:MAG: SPOR domain-containing protein [Bacteroidaceae bacterium]|jgi:cell division septation protein DedD